MGKNKDVDRPKKPLSPFMYYIKEHREDVRQDNPELDFSELGKLLGKMWRGLTDEEKLPYEELANQDRIRYQQEMIGYIPPPVDESESERKKKRDDVSLRKHWVAFLYFCHEHRNELKNVVPQLPMLQHYLGEIWANLTQIERVPYLTMAEQNISKFDEM